MRVLIATLLCLAATPALADECDMLIARVMNETGAAVDQRSSDFASFTAGSGISLTFSCGAPEASSVGAQFRGEGPPDVYYVLFGKAGHAVTGLTAATIEAAARRAQEAASRLRHSNVDESGARITCSVSNSEKGRLTMCAVIEHSERG
ncbi:ABC transporter ATPase [Methylobacterium trifolii]